MKHTILATMLAAFALAFTAQAQSKPDFSGTWTLDVDRSESAHAAGFVGPVALLIQQTPEDLTVVTRHGGESETARFKAEGAETKPVGGSGTPDSSFRWDGTKLTLQTVESVSGSAMTVTEVYSLDPSGSELTVEKSIRVEHGYTGTAGSFDYKQPGLSAVKDVFKRVNLTQ